MTKKQQLSFEEFSASDLYSAAHSVDAAASIIMPPPKRTAAGWADANRILPEGSPEPGPWRTARVPYTIPIYEAFCDPRYETIVGVMGAQMSKTELLLNVIGHRFCDGPYVPALFVGPTEKSVRSMSNDRFTKMINSTPMLAERLAKGHANKVTEKFIGGIRFGFAWAGSATELASHPAGLVLVDERDRMISNVGEEGDPVEMARARMSNYWGAKMGVFSTPTVEDASPIFSLYEEGTMMKWAWPCWHCGEYFVPRLHMLVYAKSTDMEEVKESARVVCPNCGKGNEDKHKTQFNANGKNIPHVMNAKGEHIPVDIPRSTSTASFWVSGLCSPWRSFGQRAEQLVKAYASKEPDRIQGVINTAFGELYKMKGDAPPWEAVMETRNEWPRRHIPEWAKLITMGVDVQKNGLYFVVRGWGHADRSHLIDHGYLPGETELMEVWEIWERIFNWSVDQRYIIDSAFIDSGYKPGTDRFRRPEHMVYNMCRRHPGRAFPSKGQDTLDRPIKASKIDVTQGGRVIKGGLTLWHINTDHIKSWVRTQIVPPEGIKRTWTSHNELDEDYCKQMVAEELVVKPSGHRIWIHGKRANHYFDCEVMARAAALAKQVHYIPPHEEPEEVAQEHKQKAAEKRDPFMLNLPPEADQKGSGSFINKEGSWFSRYRK